MTELNDTGYTVVTDPANPSTEPNAWDDSKDESKDVESNVNTLRGNHL